MVGGEIPLKGGCNSGAITRANCNLTKFTGTYELGYSRKERKRHILFVETQNAST